MFRRIDPETIPQPLRAAWEAVESGRYAVASLAIKKAVRSTDDEMTNAANELLELVMKDLEKRSKAAWSLGKEGKRLEAYLALDSLCQDFEGYDLPEKLVAARDSLSKRSDIQNELKATKMLAAAKNLLASEEERRVEIGIKRLNALIKRFPDTRCAQQAKAMLSEAEADAEAEG